MGLTSLIVCTLRYLVSFLFDFLVVFYSLTLFLWFSCCWCLLLYMLCDLCYFLLQCNLILTFFWLTSSGGCPNHTFRSSVISIVALQLHWNHTSAWVFSSKFAAYFQNTFSWVNLWMAASKKCKINENQRKSMSKAERK